jgi:hypothetical protein
MTNEGEVLRLRQCKSNKFGMIHDYNFALLKNSVLHDQELSSTFLGDTVNKKRFPYGSE